MRLSRRPRKTCQLVKRGDDQLFVDLFCFTTSHGARLMPIRFLLAMLMAVMLTRPLSAQTSNDHIAETLDKILTRLDAIEVQLAKLDVLDNNKAATTSVGLVSISGIAVESLVPHFDAIRTACNDPNLILGVDNQTNVLMLVTSPDSIDQTTKSIRQWIEVAKSGQILISLTTVPAQQLPIGLPYLPTQREIKKRTDILKRMFPARYQTLDEPQMEPEFASPTDLLDDRTRQPS